MVDRTQKLKRGFVAVLIVVLCGLFVACDAGISVTETQSDDENWRFQATVWADKTLVQVLESDASAQINPISGTRWTLKDWLIQYFSVLVNPDGLGRDMNVVYKGQTLEGVNWTYTFLLMIPKTGNLSQNVGVSAQTDAKSNLFVFTVDATRGNRFNAMQKLFLDAYGRYIDGTPTLADYGGEMSVILFGARNFYGKSPQNTDGLTYDANLEQWYNQTLPPLVEAFTMANMAIAKKFELSETLYASSKVRFFTPHEKVLLDRQNAAYVFSKTVEKGETQIVYRYYRADATGWYITALVLGGLTVLFIFLALRYRKNHPKIVKPTDTLKPPTSFPIDPFEGY